uniref:IS1240 protein n=1 Tax=gamma proteobacterium D250 TaxID=649546 RepID=M4HX82_9GAMM|nr:IS1240 protein [gamma proteobacterium D250]
MYPEQVRTWKTVFIEGTLSDAERYKREREEVRQSKRRIKALERDLRRKEKALAETAALLVLRKKLNALRGEVDSGDDCPRLQSGINSLAG